MSFVDCAEPLPLFPRETALVPGQMIIPGDAILKEIDAKGSIGWKNDSDYHRHSIAENMCTG